MKRWMNMDGTALEKLLHPELTCEIVTEERAFWDTSTKDFMHQEMFDVYTIRCYTHLAIH